MMFQKTKHGPRVGAIHIRFFEQWKLHVEFLDECHDFLIRARFLFAKLIAGKGQDLQTLGSIFLIQLDQFCIVAFS